MGTRAKEWLWGLALMAITLIAYAPILGGGFIWDDPDYVVNNATLRSARGLFNIWAHPTALPQYYPLVHTTFWAEYQLWGLWAPGYHVTNVLLHGLAAILLWRVLKKIAVPGAWFAASAWAVHPVNVESVAWITERKNVLMGVMYLASAWAYLEFEARGKRQEAREVRRRSDEGRERNRDSWYAVALGFFVAAMLSKTVACSLPAALMLVIGWKRGRVTWSHLLSLTPFFAIGASLALATAHLERAHVGAIGKEWQLFFAERVMIAGRALWFYALKILWPVNLAFVYPKFRVETWQWVFPAGVLLAVAVLGLMRWRGALVAVLFFAGTALPALSFVNVYPMRYTFVADHYVYIANIGLIVLVTAALARAANEWPGIARGAGGAVLALLMIGTFVRAGVFVDELSLWRDTVAKNPNSWMVHTNLGRVLADAKNVNEAERHFQRALELAPGLPETHWNVGINLAATGDPAGALREYDEALRLDPTFGEAYYSRGNLLRDQGKPAEARREYEAAIRFSPAHAKAHRNLGLLLDQEKILDGARREFEAAINAEPEYAEAHNDLGKVLVRQKQLTEAAGHFAEAVRIKPAFAEARLNFGSVLMALGQLAEAEKQVREAVQLDPSLAKYAEQALKR